MTDQRGWWRRHWKWAAPSGCLLLVLLAFGGCVAMMTGVASKMRDTGGYAQAVERLRGDADAVALLGEPIRAGWMIQGNVRDHGDTGEADYSVPVSGPRGEGTLRIRARKQDGRWNFERLRLEPAGGGAAIDLLTDGEGSGPAFDTREGSGPRV